MKYLPIKPYPFTRINDYWISNNMYDGTIPNKTYKDEIIKGHANSTRFFTSFYSCIGFDIITETVFNYPYPQITEKTLRPILHKKPFIVVGAPGILELLQSKGFKTFTPFINESYDQISNPIERFSAIMVEIKKLCDYDIVQLKSFINSINDTLEHNLENLKNLENLELKNFNANN